MRKFKEFNEHSSERLVSESQKIEVPKVYNIEDIIFNRGIVGAKQTIKVLTVMKERLSGTLLVNREEVLSISENILKASMLLTDINALTLNRIATSETLKNQFKTFTKSKRNRLLDSDITSTFMKFIEKSLNANILKAKRVDTKRKRQIEKNQILRFYRNASKDIPLIFKFLTLVIDTKNEISKKFKKVKDEDSEVKIEEGLIEIRAMNNTTILIMNEEIN